MEAQASQARIEMLVEIAEITGFEPASLPPLSPLPMAITTSITTSLPWPIGPVLIRPREGS